MICSSIFELKAKTSILQKFAFRLDGSMILKVSKGRKSTKLDTKSMQNKSENILIGITNIIIKNRRDRNLVNIINITIRESHGP